ncbi:MAG: hypothetical protein II295_09565 [Akkermansia sp.]|nr:hypothetical protein [Akkermansia sp.]
MQDSPFVLGFTAGELSPWLSTRFDLQAYHRGAALLQNFLVQPYGGICRRSGTTYVGAAAVQGNDAVRLLPFCFSETDALMLELFPGGMRVYRHGQPVLAADGSVYQLAAPWSSAAEVQALRCTQVNDVIYITSAYRAPLVLSRYADNDWLCTEFAPNPFPRETYQPQAVALSVKMKSDNAHATLSIDAERGGFTEAMVGREMLLAEADIPSRTLFQNMNITFKTAALPDLYSENVVGSTYYYETDSSSKMLNFYTVISPYLKSYYNGNSSAAGYPDCFMPGIMLLDNGQPYEVCGDWELRTHGEWNAVWELWRSYNTKLDEIDFKCWQWTRIRTIEQNNLTERQNYIVSGTETTPCRMVLVCRSAASSSLGAHIYFNILGGRREYKFRITEYISSREATGRMLSYYVDTCSSFSTHHWSFGAYGPRNGYPLFTGLHQGRLWFGGFAGLPTTLIASTVDDFTNFDVRSADDAALHLTLATPNQSRICWVCPARHLLVGTTESEWTLAAHDGSAISATNAAFTRQSSVGSELMPADAVENTVFYVQRGGKRLREISYKLTADGFTSTDTSLLAEHLFDARVQEWVVQRGSSSRLWVLMKDHTVAVLTSNVEQQVTAWQRFCMPGREVLHLATLPAADNSDEELWLVVRNTANGFISIERMGAGGGFVDGARMLPAPTSSLAMAPHLAGLRALAYPEGSPELACAVDVAVDGSYFVPAAFAGQPYCMGASYVSELHTLPLENERSYNTVRQEGRVRLRLLESDPSFCYRSTHVSAWETYTPATDHRTYPYTGDIRVSQLPAPAVGQGVAIKVDGALDFRLVSLTVEFDYHGR